MVLSLRFDQIFESLPADDTSITFLRAQADLIVETIHLDGSTVQARMTESLVLGGADALALATFHDVTEQLWLADRRRAVTVGD